MQHFPEKRGEKMKCSCDICHDVFKLSTIKKNYTLVTCQACKHTFCLKHSSTREQGKFLKAILDDLCLLKEPIGSEARILRKQGFKDVKEYLWFKTEPLGSTLQSTEKLIPKQMGSLLKAIDEVIAGRIPLVLENYPATLCPFCTLEYIDTETLLSFCLLELKQNYPSLTLDELIHHLVRQLKQNYQTLENLEYEVKGGG